MKYEYNPKMGTVVPSKEAPSKEILNAVRRTDRIPNFGKNDLICLTNDIAIGANNGYNYLIVRIRNQWRFCGIIVDPNTIKRHVRGPLVNFQQCWANGFPFKQTL